MNQQKNKMSAFFIVVAIAFIAPLFGGLSDAYAVPAFARQTGMECAACHVGSFGPQLTSFGRAFKLNAYSLDAGNDKPSTLSPDGQKTLKEYLQGLSAMAFGGYEHTNGDLRRGTELTGNQQRLGTNNDFTLDQVSLFYGGQVFSHVGMLAQATYSNPNESFGWDQADLRYANNTQIDGKPLIYGVMLNNNPSVQDVWNTTPAWGFPYVTSALMPDISPTAAPFITTLGLKVGGAGVYGMWNDWLYAELTGYTTLPDSAQRTLGQLNAHENDHLSKIAPYWRLALQHDFGPHYVEVGTYGIAADRYPGNMQGIGTDKFLDYAADATYQYTTGKHSISVYASALHEHANLDASVAATTASNLTDSLTSLNANIAYYYNNTYGLTFKPFSITGSSDLALYGNGVNNKPNSAGWTLQADYTPFGTSDSFAYPYLNMRFFVQYTAYTKFNGLGNNYDGLGRNASDNNLLFTGVWFAF